MKDAGLTVARLGEFAWSTLEPSEGEYDLDWLVRAVELLHAHGQAAVIGTPTAAPPAWLTAKYIETLRVGEDGRLAQHGKRCHYCVNSPVYHAKAVGIVAAMAGRLGRLPGVIGWQIDNEFGQACYCGNCRMGFQAFLHGRFGQLTAFNHHLSTAYWSQTYSDWSEIPLPIGPHNPGLMLEFRRYVTESHCRFQRLQIETLRPWIGAGQFITHNYFNLDNEIDHHVLAADLDLASWDYYVGSGHHDYIDAGLTFDFTRGLKRRSFWIMETQPGRVNWSSANNDLDRGEVRALAWQAVAHGADAVCYWQWRSAPGGQEQYHGTLVGADGEPRPLIAEVSRIGREFAALGDLHAGEAPRAEVAILYSCEARWSTAWQRHHEDFDYVRHLRHYYGHFCRRNVHVDILPAGADIDGYKLVVAPALLILDQGVTDKLEAYVRAGGHLVLTVRCGLKDEYNALLPARQPGPLAELAGVEVEEYYALVEEAPIVAVDGSGLTGTSCIWAERLKPRVADVQVLAVYGRANGWLDGHPAIATLALEPGRVTYVGVILDDAAQDVLTGRLLSTAGVSPLLRTPPGVEARGRTTLDGREVYFLINHARGKASVEIPWAGRDVLTGTEIRPGALALGPYDVVLLVRTAKCEETGTPS